jgi:hypothetical protein
MLIDVGTQEDARHPCSTSTRADHLASRRYGYRHFGAYRVASRSHHGSDPADRVLSKPVVH